VPVPERTPWIGTPPSETETEAGTEMDSGTETGTGVIRSDSHRPASPGRLT